MPHPQDDLLQTSLDAQYVILAAAHLDKTLRVLLEWHTQGASKKLKDDLFDGNGPIATFSAKISVSYAFGFITQADHINLNIVRKVRNEFAHADDFVNFETPSVRKLLGQPGRTGRSIFEEAGYAASKGLQKQIDNVILLKLKGATYQTSTGKTAPADVMFQKMLDERDR